MAVMKTLSLVKGRQYFCFRYEVGQEAKVLESLIEAVNRRDLSFDWFDAALVSHQLRNRLLPGLQRNETPTSPVSVLINASTPKAG